MNVNAFKEDHETPLITTNPYRSQSLIADKEDRPRRGCLQRWRYGWKITLSLASASCVVVLAFNLGFLSWAAARHRVHGDQGVLYEGECDHVRHLSTGIHLLINILGTILLGASNYCMQCLCAPTRRDIDKAHAKGNWLDVGVPSFRNLFYVSRLRSFMWIVLVLSSFPLHLVYNSTIFSTTAAYSYMIFAGPDPTRQSGQPNITANGFSDEVQANLRQLYNDARNGSSEYEHMDSSECINAYATTYQTKYGDVLLIPPTDNGTNQYAVVDSQSVFDPPSYIPGPSLKDDPFQWLCPAGPNKSCSSYVPSLQSQADEGNWVVHVNSGDYRANSCLVRKVPELCKLQYSLALTITVIVANVIKGAIMLYMAITSAEPPMLTTGDAVSSFLHQPDNVTQRRCLITQKQFRIYHHYPLHGKNIFDKPLAYSAKPKRWYTVVSLPRWMIISLMWAISAFAFSSLLIIGVRSDRGAAWAAEFGAINAQALIRDGDWPTSLVANTIIANIPQLMFSALYFAFNSVLTSMASAAEWSRFCLARRGLRVSWNPQGSQRSSYFLSLPYRYAVPLMSCSALLHWLISQSLFLVGIDAYRVGFGRTPERDVMTCGYTPRAIISGIAIGIFMFTCLVAVSCKKLASGMPVAGSCTFAISAACHPTYNPNNEESKPADPLEGIEFMPLKWGAVPGDGPMGHCAFSEKTVEMPQDRNLYQ